MLHIVLICVLTLSLMFPTVFKPGEIRNFIQGNRLVAITSGKH